MAIAFLSSASRAVTSSSPSTITVHDAPAASLLILGTRIGSSVLNPTVSTVTDSDGNVWKFARRSDVSTGTAPQQHAEIWYAANASGVSTSLSVVVSWLGHASSLITDNHVAVFSGADNTSPLDQTSANRFAAASTIFAGDLTPTVDGCVLFEMIGVDTNAAMTVGAGYTKMSTRPHSGSQYVIQGTAATSSGTTTWASPRAAAAVMAAFRPPSGPADPSTGVFSFMLLGFQ